MTKITIRIIYLQPQNPRTLTHCHYHHLLPQPCHPTCWRFSAILSSIMDPDPQVFVPPGSGSISQRNGSGPGSGPGSFPFLIKMLSGLNGSGSVSQRYRYRSTDSDPHPEMSRTYIKKQLYRYSTNFKEKELPQP
jgi:hypothetical protein